MAKKYDWLALAKRLREAYAEECRSGECGCITNEEHELQLKGGK